MIVNDLQDAISLDARCALNIAITKSRCKNVSKQVFSLWPNLRDASEKLAGYISALHPSIHSDSLLADTLKKAFTTFRSSQGRESERASEFLYELIKCADTIIKYQLSGRIGKNKRLVWEPFSVPIPEWVVRNEICALDWELVVGPSVQHDTFRWMLAAKILSFSDTEKLLVKYSPRSQVPTTGKTILRVVK